MGKLPITLLDDIEDNLSLQSIQNNADFNVIQIQRCIHCNKSKNKLIMDEIRIDLVANNMSVNCSSPCSPLSPTFEPCNTMPYIIHNDLKIIYINVHNLPSNSNKELSPLELKKNKSTNNLYKMMQLSPSWMLYNDIANNDDDDNSSCHQLVQSMTPS